MSTVKKLSFTKKDESILFVISSAFLITFLFYIDEGNNSFSVFKGAFAWIIFLIYFIPTLAGQFLVSKLLSTVDNGSGKTLISMFLGALIGVITVVSLFYFFI